jgi:hypothetical protein
MPALRRFEFVALAVACAPFPGRWGYTSEAAQAGIAPNERIAPEQTFILPTRLKHQVIRTSRS